MFCAFRNVVYNISLDTFQETSVSKVIKVYDTTTNNNNLDFFSAFTISNALGKGE